MGSILQIEEREISLLIPDPDNARARGPRGIQAIAASLEAFGQQKPIIVAADGTIIAGNGVAEAARSLGWKTVLAIVSDLPASEARAFAVADNRTAELSYWNEPALHAALEAAAADDALATTGFDLTMLNALREAASDDAGEHVPSPSTSQPNDEPEEVVAEMPHVVAVAFTDRADARAFARDAKKRIDPTCAAVKLLPKPD